MFRGLNAINLDNKGRFAIPTRYRQEILQSAVEKVFHLIVTIDPEAACLLLYPVIEWEEIEKKLQDLPSFNPAARRIQRLLIGHATELELDNTGRILLPSLLRDYADINKTIMLVGQGRKFEIWDEGRWHEMRASWLQEETRQKEDLPAELEKLSL